ncbi:MAG: hypothetical protein NC120_02430 [Ruminococcus sp.]|nr:hypothetical protein [Ruminococcus sp.]
MNEIKKGDTVLARHIKPEDIKEGLSFFSADEEFIQVGAWNYGKGKDLLAHIHNEIPRTATRTCETLYVISGAIEAKIYGLDREPVDTFTVKAGEILILLECGHGYKVLEDNTKVLEVKNGPYLGAETDRYRI